MPRVLLRPRVLGRKVERAQRRLAVEGPLVRVVVLVPGQRVRGLGVQPAVTGLHARHHRVVAGLRGRLVDGEVRDGGIRPRLGEDGHARGVDRGREEVAVQPALQVVGRDVDVVEGGGHGLADLVLDTGGDLLRARVLEARVEADDLGRGHLDRGRKQRERVGEGHIAQDRPVEPAVDGRRRDAVVGEDALEEVRGRAGGVDPGGGAEDGACPSAGRPGQTEPRLPHREVVRDLRRLRHRGVRPRRGRVPLAVPAQARIDGHGPERGPVLGVEAQLALAGVVEEVAGVERGEGLPIAVDVPRLIGGQRAEVVAALDVALALLTRGSEVEVEAEAEPMPLAHDDHVVRDLVATGLEHAGPRGVAAEGPEAGDRDQGPALVRLLQAVVGPQLRGELVDQAGPEHRRQPDLDPVAVRRPQVIRLLGLVGRRGVEVEVLAAQPRVRVLDVEPLGGGQLQVEARERRGRVVGPVVLALQGGQRRGHDDSGRLRLELRHEGDAQEVLLRGHEEVGPVGGDRPPDGAAELVLLIVQRAAEGVGRGQAAVAVEIEELAVDRVRARLGHDVDEAGGRAADAGGGAGAHHLELLDRGLGEEEDPFVAAALVALQGIVEVGAVDGDVGVDRALAGDDEAGAVRFLDDRRREQDEVGEVPAPRGQVGDGARIDGQAARGVGLVDQARLRRDRDLLAADGLEVEGDGLCRAHAQRDVVPPAGQEPGGRGFDHIASHGQQGRDETAVRARADRARITGRGSGDPDAGVGDGLAVGTVDLALEGRAPGFGLGGRLGRTEAGREKPDEEEREKSSHRRPPRVYMPFTCPRRGVPSPRTPAQMTSCRERSSARSGRGSGCGDRPSPSPSARSGFRTSRGA